MGYDYDMGVAHIHKRTEIHTHLHHAPNVLEAHACHRLVELLAEGPHEVAGAAAAGVLVRALGVAWGWILFESNR